MVKSPVKTRAKHPISSIHWVHRDRVEPNDWNPNTQITPAMALLIESIRADGWTQPIVVRPAKAKAKGKHTIIDGEHRWRASAVLQDELGPEIPVVILGHDDAGCIASTVRHNRARGSHGIEATAALVERLLEAGLSDEDVIDRLGLDPLEFERLRASEEKFLRVASGVDQLMT